MHLAAGTFDPSLHLPCHLCFFAATTLPFVVTMRYGDGLEILYYWTFSGVLQASLTPAEVLAPPHFDFFRFWMMHSGAIVTIVYYIVVYDWRPTVRGIWLTFFVTFGFLFVVTPINLIFESNYFFVCQKPPRSALDLLPEWPWYIFFVILIALMHFWLAYLPFAIMKRRQVSE